MLSQSGWPLEQTEMLDQTSEEGKNGEKTKKPNNNRVQEAYQRRTESVRETTRRKIQDNVLDVWKTFMSKHTSEESRDTVVTTKEQLNESKRSDVVIQIQDQEGESPEVQKNEDSRTEEEKRLPFPSSKLSNV